MFPAEGMGWQLALPTHCMTFFQQSPLSKHKTSSCSSPRPAAYSLLARVVLGPGQRRVLGHVCDDLSQLAAEIGT